MPCEKTRVSAGLFVGCLGVPEGALLDNPTRGREREREISGFSLPSLARCLVVPDTRRVPGRHLEQPARRSPPLGHDVRRGPPSGQPSHGLAGVLCALDLPRRGVVGQQRSGEGIVKETAVLTRPGQPNRIYRAAGRVIPAYHSSGDRGLP